MSLILSGTDGLSDVDGTAATPAIRGTDANTGIFFPAADTIAFAEGGAEAARFDSSGQLGIGTTTPDALLHAYKTSGKVATFGNNVNNNGNYIVLGGSVSNKNWVLSNNMIVGGEFGIGRTSANGGTTIGSAHDLMIDTNGGVKVANTLGVGYTTPSTSGAGITFPATQSASTDANTLDDYEEGSYEPTLTQTDNTAPSVTYSVQVGRYTKVGTLVHVQGYINLSSKGTASGNVRFNNLPFANANVSNALAAPAISIFGNTTSLTTTYVLSGDMPSNNVFMSLGYTNGSGGNSSLTWANLQNTFFIEFSFTYQASA